MSVLRVITKPLRDAYENRDTILEKAKDLPMHVLQTALSGVGQALLVGDRVRNAIKRSTMAEDDTKPAETSSAPDKPREPVIYEPRPEKAPAADVPAADVPVADAPADVAVSEEAPEPVAPASAVVAPEPAVAAEPAAVVAPEPIPGYADLTIASLRARLRGRSADQVRELLAYETATANRGDVIKLYENRLAKLTTEAEAAR
jgi:hypothetical protein